MGEHGEAALLLDLPRGGLVVAVNTGKALAVIGKVAGQVAVAYRGGHIQFDALWHVEHTVFVGAS